MEWPFDFGGHVIELKSSHLKGGNTERIPTGPIGRYGMPVHIRPSKDIKSTKSKLIIPIYYRSSAFIKNIKKYLPWKVYL